MIIFNLFNELDEIIMLQFGDEEAALQSDRGKQLLQQLLSDENRQELREWYKLHPQLNPSAQEFKERLERELGEKL